MTADFKESIHHSVYDFVDSVKKDSYEIVEYEKDHASEQEGK